MERRRAATAICGRGCQTTPISSWRWRRGPARPSTTWASLVTVSTGEVAFQGSNGDLWITGSHGTGDAHLKMMPGTSPSIDDGGEVALQGKNGDLWIWKLGSSAVDLGLGMMAGTSPSISRDPGSIPVNVIAGGPGNDRLNGTVRDDLMFGGRGNDVIHGRAGNEVIYGGPGNDRIDGGPGNDRIDGGPGNDRIVDHQAPRSCSRKQGSTGSTWPMAAATIGCGAPPARPTTSLPTGVIRSRAAAGANGRPSAKSPSGSPAANANTVRPTQRAHSTKSSAVTKRASYGWASPALATLSLQIRRHEEQKPDRQTRCGDLQKSR